MTLVKCSNYLFFVVVVDCLPLAMFEMLDMILSSSGIYFVMENFVFASLGLIPKILEACSLLALPTYISKANDSFLELNLKCSSAVLKVLRLSWVTSSPKNHFFVP